MGSIRAPLPVKLIVGMLAGSPQALDLGMVALAQTLGPVDYASDDLPFDYTDYYCAELGPHILRRFVAISDLVDPGRLADIKVQTNGLEDSLRQGGRRTVNLDPGYICGGKLVLATTKDNAHRIYLGQGIYAEVTLIYRGRRFCPLPWTYPDYASGDYDPILRVIRERYMDLLRASRAAGLLDYQAHV